MRHRDRFGLLLAISGLLCAGRAGANVVTDWNATLLDAIRSTSTNPPRASRAMAMVQCAVFDAVNGLAGRPYVPYAQTGNPPHLASTHAAAAAAAHRVLVHLYPALQPTFDVALTQSLQGIPPIPRIRGINWGRACADTIIALRSNDNSNLVVPYAPPSGPGFWIPTPPAFAPALLPNWPLVTPWAMDAGSQFLVPPPPALDSSEYTAAFNEVRSLGEIDSTTRTAEQTEIGLFWADGAGTATPPGHWCVIAGDIAEDQDLSVLETSRLFAIVGCAVADAAICSWDAKYTYHHWRPVTGIRLADTDSNPATEADPEWAPLIVTPPFPSYTSGHSTFSGAASRVIANFFGTNDIAFTTTSDALPGVTRSFSSLSDAAAEAANSRLFGGIHWRYDNEQGLVAGQALADHVSGNLFGLLGDIDHDGDVDVQDLLLLVQAWGACPVSGDCPADLNSDGMVNAIDLLILLHHRTH